MCIRVRHTFINADWVARTTRRSGNMPKTMASRLSRKTQTFKNVAYCTDTRQKSSGCAQRTARVTRSRVSCERLSRLSLGSFRGTKNPAWSWAPERRPGNSSPLRTFSSKGPATQSYYRARYYDSRTGRFLNEDPILFAGNINFYSYVSNNPVGRIDPSGLIHQAWHNHGAAESRNGQSRLARALKLAFMTTLRS